MTKFILLKKNFDGILVFKFHSLISIMKLLITRVFNCYGLLIVKFGVGLVVSQPFIQN